MACAIRPGISPGGADKVWRQAEVVLRLCSGLGIPASWVGHSWDGTIPDPRRPRGAAKAVSSCSSSQKVSLENTAPHSGVLSTQVSWDPRATALRTMTRGHSCFHIFLAEMAPDGHPDFKVTRRPFCSLRVRGAHSRGFRPFPLQGLCLTH